MLKAQVRASPATSNPKVSKPTSPAPIVKSKTVIWLDEVGFSPSITKCVTIEARSALLRLAVNLNMKRLGVNVSAELRRLVKLTLAEKHFSERKDR